MGKNKTKKGVGVKGVQNKINNTSFFGIECTLARYVGHDLLQKKFTFAERLGDDAVGGVSKDIFL